MVLMSCSPTVFTPFVQHLLPLLVQLEEVNHQMTQLQQWKVESCDRERELKRLFEVSQTQLEGAHMRERELQRVLSDMEGQVQRLTMELRQETEHSEGQGVANASLEQQLLDCRKRESDLQTNLSDSLTKVGLFFPRSITGAHSLDLAWFERLMTLLSCGKKQLAASEERCCGLATGKAEAEDRKTNAEHTVSQKQLQVEQLQLQVTELVSNLARSEARVQDLETQRSQNEVKLLQLEENLVEKRELHSASCAVVQQQLLQLQAKEVELSELKESRALAEQLHQNVLSELHESRVLGQRLDATVECLRNGGQEATARCDALSEFLETSRGENSRLMGEVSALTQQVKDLEASGLEKQSQIEALREQLTLIQDKLGESQTRNAVMQQEKEALLSQVCV